MALLPAKITKSVVARLKKDKDLPDWVKDAAVASILMRDGDDYVNTRRRYDKAEHLLLRAVHVANTENASPIDQARMLLWLGICMNENLSKGTPKTRNAKAIDYYKDGLMKIRYVRGDDVAPIRMALYNSLGVSHHHFVEAGIPKKAFDAYRRARKVYDAHPHLRDKLQPIMDKVAQNSGGHVTAGGGPHMKAYYGGNYVV